MLELFLPKDSHRIRFLYLIGSVFWLALIGIGAMNMRTYLESQGSIKFDEIYYFFLTFHGDSGFFIFIEIATVFLVLYISHLRGQELGGRLLSLLFWTANIGAVIYFLGGPITGWYLQYPLSLQPGSFIGIYGIDYWISYVGIIIISVSFSILGLRLFKVVRDTILRTSSILMGITEPFLGIVAVIDIVGIFGKTLSAIIPTSVFWIFGSSSDYYMTYATFGLLYYFIPYYGSRPISEKWVKWFSLPLLILPILSFSSDLLTWPIPVPLKIMGVISSYLLSGFLGLLIINLIKSLNMYKLGDVKSFFSLLCYIGFIISAIPSLLLPEPFLDTFFHNTYYVVGSFHSIIWDFLIVGLMTGLVSFAEERRKYSESETILLNLGIILWSITSTVLAYLMMEVGYFGLIRREIIYSPGFKPIMVFMSFLAYDALTSITLVVSIPLWIFISSIKGPKSIKKIVSRVSIIVKSFSK
ncbi:cbb3-type cytochrome c oxidase subunit I [Candidatus Acidianus copahuensis]|nr:cbb3-type cytochrome c oxidase subunit I [Candidatus Acidianus copahuensis]